MLANLKKESLALLKRILDAGEAIIAAGTDYERLRRKVDNFRVTGGTFTNGGDQMSLALPPAQRAPSIIAASSPFVRVKQSGGVAGSATTNCTFTYDLYALDNTTKLNTTGGVVTPKNPRFSHVAYTAATYGEYFIDADGSYALFLWNEAPAGAECT